jgi:hypothetical protein
MITVDDLQRENRLLRGDYRAAQRERDESMGREKALREQVAGLTAALADAKSSLAFVRTWSKYIDLQGLLTTTPLKEDFWSWAEGWDCDLELRINAALAASPAPKAEEE